MHAVRKRNVEPPAQDQDGHLDHEKPSCLSFACKVFPLLFDLRANLDSRKHPNESLAETRHYRVLLLAKRR